MNPRHFKIQLAVYIAALALMAAVWAWSGFQETWLYVVMAIVVIPNPWWVALINKVSKK